VWCSAEERSIPEDLVGLAVLVVEDGCGGRGEERRGGGERKAAREAEARRRRRQQAER
jgi:hypothetical protein